MEDMIPIRFEALNGYSEVFMLNRLVRLSKSDDGKYTFIYLSNGEKIKTESSINTLEVRINNVRREGL